MSMLKPEKLRFCILNQNCTRKFYVLEVSKVDTVDRIFEVLDRLPMEQQQFAKLVGVSDDTASDWRRRRSASYTKRLTKIAEVLGTSVEYLLTGEKKEPAAEDSSEREKEFVQLFQKLTPEQQDMMLAQLKGVVDSQGN